MVVGSQKQGENYSFAVLTLSVTIYVLLCSLLWNLLKSYKTSPPLPPGPRGLPMVGYLPFLSNELHKQFMDLASVYGPIFHVWLGKKLWVVVSSPSLVKEVVRDKDAFLANRDTAIARQIFSYDLQDIAWTTYGPYWKKVRKIFVRETQSKANLDDPHHFREQAMKMIMKEINSKIGMPIDIGEMIFALNINGVINMIWGGTTFGEKGKEAVIEFRDAVAEALEMLGKLNISDFFPALARFDLQGVERQTKEIMIKFEKFLQLAIERCSNKLEGNKAGLKNDDQRKDFLQTLLELKENEESLTMTQLKALLVNIVIGASHTTSTVSEWAMAELMEHREIMEKVCDEINDVVGLNNSVEEFHLPKLSYLNAVVKETLRLHPPAPLIMPRKASMLIQLGGYRIPKDTTVLLNAYSVHRDPQVWENPLQFWPERFMNKESSIFDFEGNNFQFIPFGSGRRVCAAVPMAERMMMYQLASLVHSFELDLPKEAEIKFSSTVGLVTEKADPLILIPTKRLMELAS